MSISLTKNSNLQGICMIKEPVANIKKSYESINDEFNKNLPRITVTDIHTKKLSSQEKNSRGDKWS